MTASWTRTEAGYQPVCDDCGASGPVVAIAGTAAMSARAHRCDQVCAHCSWGPVKSQGRGGRGLCDRCYSTEIRYEYAGWGGRSRASLIEDAEWMADDGANLTQVLHRLGYRYAESFRRACDRAGRLDVYERLSNRMPNAEDRAAVRAGLRKAG